jgi:hypothetical protein
MNRTISKPTGVVTVTSRDFIQCDQVIDKTAIMRITSQARQRFIGRNLMEMSALNAFEAISNGNNAEISSKRKGSVAKPIEAQCATWNFVNREADSISH